MLGLKVKRSIIPIPNMREIATAEQMIPVILKLIEQDKENRKSETSEVFAVAICHKYLKGIDFAERYNLHSLLKEKGYWVTWYERPCLLGRQYDLIVPKAYWTEVRDDSKYLKGSNSIREALLKRLKRESVCVTLVG